VTSSPVLHRSGRARSVSFVAGYTFLSDGWWSLTRPSSSHLTIASSSFACSTVPNAPVGFPKLPKPSPRSPGFNSWSVVAASASGGFLARSESGTAPACARGGWGALRNLGIGLLVIWLIFDRFLSGRRAPPLAAWAHRFDKYSIGSERIGGWSELHSSGNWRPISGERKGSTRGRSAVHTTNIADAQREHCRRRDGHDGPSQV